MKNKILTSIICITVLLVILFITAIVRLNSNLLFTAHKQIDISLKQEFQDEDIINILKEVVGKRSVKVQKLEIYGDMVSISLKEISDEELENLNTKINEKYGTENKVEDIKVTDVPKVSLGDYMSSYIKPFFISLTLIVVYVGIYVLIQNKKNK